jgi:hypothetical protein
MNRVGVRGTFSLSKGEHRKPVCPFKVSGAEFPLETHIVFEIHV